MDDITLPGYEDDGVIFEVKTLVEHLEQVPDERQARGKRYQMSLLLTLIVLAKLAGEQKPSGIAQWLQLRRQQLVEAFGCRHAQVPSLNTIRRKLRQEQVSQALQPVLGRFLHQCYGGQQSELVALDGKTLRRTIPKGKTQEVHLLAAYLPAEGVVLMQAAVASKENEITIAPQLLSALDLKGRVVCGDAMFTQRTMSTQIMAQGADYIWTLKDNQPNMKADAVQFFKPPRRAPGWQAPPLPQTKARAIQLGHGRLEKRTLRLMPDEHGFLDWPGVQQVFQLKRRVTQLTTGEVSEETVYGITSLHPERVTAEQLLSWVQSYWGIENGLHYRRDVTLGEDALRMTNEIQAQVMATLNNFIVGLVRKLGFDNLAAAQRLFDAKLTLALAAHT
jgi:predicted transposase YbfD/YdcC